MTEYDDTVMDDAEQVVLAFIDKHHHAAVPALIGYCTMWTVDNGALSLIKSTLANAIRAADEMESIRMRDAT